MRAASDTQSLTLIDRHIDVARLTEAVRDICCIPSVLGDEKGFAEYLVEMMRASGFDNTALQSVLPNRPNANGHIDFGGRGRTVVPTGHLDTKPRHTAGPSPSRSPAS